ncbi:hypothetical protein CKAN_01570000 [Cinnamomum micranthum f. kanehirae]|uniref:Uncharacterized protein n=1 Tax=Cinnamomum micranthum f. kanehirae TaxID=337451 RepID=A0A3S3QML2_9MAGN|nr:hypothetical protein CKAN_01570000 [Cinnamomum micranthum f. kanehirae]
MERDYGTDGKLKEVRSKTEIKRSEGSGGLPQLCEVSQQSNTLGDELSIRFAKDSELSLFSSFSANGNSLRFGAGNTKTLALILGTNDAIALEANSPKDENSTSKEMVTNRSRVRKRGESGIEQRNKTKSGVALNNEHLAAISAGRAGRPSLRRREKRCHAFSISIELDL